MAVLSSQRSTSEIQFLQTARELQVYSIQKCAHYPKRYTFYVSQPLAAIATRIYEDLKLGNSIFPTNAHEAQMRIDYFLKAKAELYNLISQIEVANEIAPFEEKAMRNWMEIIDKEIKLVKALIKADRARYKDLP